jgi:Restriction endonuclease
MSKQWEQYEQYICRRLREWAGDTATIEFNAKLPGKFSGVLRQVDALVTGDFAGATSLTAAVDCKRYSRKVHVKHVDQFVGFVGDVQTDVGLLVTNIGFTPAAHARASQGIKLLTVEHVPQPQIFVAEIDNLPRIYRPADDEPYYEGDYYEGGPGNKDGAIIRYWHEPYSEEGFSFDPEREPEWMDDVVAAGPDDELSWGSNAGRTTCATAILRHRHSGQDPTDEAVETFVVELASQWTDGQTWVLYAGELVEFGL